MHVTLQNAPKPVKHTLNNLTMATKLELFRKLEKVTSVAKLCDKYGAAKQVSDIKKAKPKLMEYMAQYCVDASASNSGKVLPRKHMKTGKGTGLDAAVIKWYILNTTMFSGGKCVWQSKWGYLISKQAMVGCGILETAMGSLILNHCMG